MKYVTTIDRTCATDIIRVYYNNKTNLFILKERGRDEKIIYNFQEKAFEHIDRIGNLHIQMLIHAFFTYNNDKILELIEDKNINSLAIIKHDLTMPNIDYNNGNYIYKLNNIINKKR